MRKTIAFVTVVIVGSILCTVANSESLPVLHRFVHRMWQVDDGMPSDQINAIAETDDGYMWFGTGAGLARFDGYKFTVFNNEKCYPA